MRKLLATLMGLMLCASAWGQAFSIFDPAMQAPPVASAAPCSTYHTTNSWDDFIDGFQTASTGYESNGWVGVGTTANIYPSADSSALTTGKPDGACSQALKIIIPTDGTETYARANLGSIIDLDTIQVTLTFALYIEDVDGVFQLWGYRSSVNPSSILGIYLQKTTTEIRLTALGSSNVAIQAGQWYTVRLTLDTAAASGGSTLDVWSSSGLVGSVTCTRGAGTDLQYLFFGPCNSLDATTDYGTVWFDLVSIKTN